MSFRFLFLEISEGDIARDRKALYRGNVVSLSIEARVKCARLFRNNDESKVGGQEVQKHWHYERNVCLAGIVEPRSSLVKSYRGDVLLWRDRCY